MTVPVRACKSWIDRAFCNSRDQSKRLEVSGFLVLCVLSLRTQMDEMSPKILESEQQGAKGD